MRRRLRAIPGPSPAQPARLTRREERRLVVGVLDRRGRRPVLRLRSAREVAAIRRRTLVARHVGQVVLREPALEAAQRAAQLLGHVAILERPPLGLDALELPLDVNGEASHRRDEGLRHRVRHDAAARARWDVYAAQTMLP